MISYNGPYLRSEATDAAQSTLISGLVFPGVSPPLRDSGICLPRYTGIRRPAQDKLKTSPSKLVLRSTTNRPSSGGRRFVIGNRQRHTPGHHRDQVQSDVNPLEWMEAHRRFHAAESGQLIPRGRRHTDMVLTTPLAPSASDSEDSDSSSNRVLSWPPRTANMNLGRQLSHRVKRMECPQPVPFRAFVESLPTPKAPPSAWTEKTQAKIEAKTPTRTDMKVSNSSRASDTISKTSTHTRNSSTSSTSVTIPNSPTDLPSIPSTRYRKINDGFEILPAGSLEKEPRVKEFGTWHENSKTSKKKSKKLQKRARSDSESRRSSVESHRLSEDSFRLPIF